MIFSETDTAWMKLALQEAQKAARLGEVPVGAVLVEGDSPLAASGNSPIASIDPTAHAEIKVIRQAALVRNNYRLGGTTVYVTLEPCLMCMGAIIHCRIERLIFGAFDPKTGAAVSRYQIGSDDLLNHRLSVSGGLLEEQCGELLKEFFQARRS